MRTTSYRLSSLLILAGLTTFTPLASAKKPQAPPKDEIEVVGHIPLTNGPVKRFLATQHYSSYYLYAERDPGQAVTLIDVTKTSQPFVLADLAYAPTSASDSVTVVAGTEAAASRRGTMAKMSS